MARVGVPLDLPEVLRPLTGKPRPLLLDLIINGVQVRE